MLVCEVILSADRELDLAKPTVYPEWFHTLFRWKPNNIRVEGDSVVADFAEEDFPSAPLGLLPFSSAWDTPDDELWCSPIRQMWEQGIRSLRFAAKQVRSEKTRVPGIDSASAERVWTGYMSCLRFTVRFHEGKFSGYQLLASPGVSFREAPKFWESLGTRQREIAMSIDAFFQKSFSSLVDALRPEHFCADCGCALAATTPTGRESRASVCAKCSLKRWKKNAGEEKVREQWKKNKQEERDATKRPKGS